MIQTSYIKDVLIVTGSTTTTATTLAPTTSTTTSATTTTTTTSTTTTRRPLTAPTLLLHQEVDGNGGGSYFTRDNVLNVGTEGDPLYSRLGSIQDMEGRRAAGNHTELSIKIKLVSIISI